MSPAENGKFDGSQDPSPSAGWVGEPPAPPTPPSGPEPKRKRRRFLAGGAGAAIAIAIAIRLAVGAGLFAARTATQPGGVLSSTIIRDDFSKADDRWSVLQNARVTAGFTGGTYQIVVARANDGEILTSYYEGIDWNAVRVEADGKKAGLKVPEGAYGVACLSGDSYYAFQVDPDRFAWGIFKGSTRQGSRDQDLSMGADASISGDDGTNHFRVECTNRPNGQTTLVFRVNGRELTRYVDLEGLSHFTGMAFLVDTLDEGGVDVRFDNVVMTRV